LKSPKFIIGEEGEGKRPFPLFEGNKIRAIENNAPKNNEIGPTLLLVNFKKIKK
jgi:hypothetical protein